MTDEDRGRFATVMTVLGEVFGREVTVVLVGSYFEVLKDLDIAQIEATANTLIGKATREDFFPRPGDFRPQLASQALSQWGLVLKAIASKSTCRDGCCHEVRFDPASDASAMAAVGTMGGLDYLAALTERDMSFRLRDFVSLYESAITLSSHAPLLEQTATAQVTRATLMRLTRAIETEPEAEEETEFRPPAMYTPKPALSPEQFEQRKRDMLADLHRRKPRSRLRFHPAAV